MVRPCTGRIFETMPGRKVIENRAWACLERCRRKLGLDEIPLPVPVEDWIEGPLGIRLSYADLSRCGAELEGGASISDNEILIDEGATANEARLRFTCAHELGHLVLHRRAKSMFHDLVQNGPYANPEKFEREADRFAAAFLMPVSLIERELVRIFDERGLKRGKAVIHLMHATLESEWLWRRVVLPEITKRFGASLPAVVNRMSDLQPQTVAGTPLLPAEFGPVLKHRSNRPELDHVAVEDGVAVRRDLFNNQERERK